MENFKVYTLSGWEDKKQKILSSLPVLSDKHIITTEGINSNYTDYHNFTKPSYYDIVIDILSEELKDFKNLIRQDIDIFSMWFETSNKFQYHAPHTHGDCGYSCVLYVCFDKTIHKSTKFYMNGEYQPDVKEGDLLIFPSNLLHEAPKNTSDKPRTIISFNIRVL